MTGIEGAWLIGAFSTAVSILRAVAGADSQESNRKAAEKAQQDASRGHLVARRSTSEPIRLIYGTQRVGLNEAYLGTAGDRNDHLHMILLVGEGEINGINQIFLNDKPHTDYPGLVTYQFYSGTSAQTVDPTIAGAITSFTDPMRHTAYLYMRLQYDRDKFQGKPNVTVVAQGLKVYDPRDTITKFSSNPALAARDLITRSSRRGGMGIAAARLDDTSFGDVATYCDNHGWTCNIDLSSNVSVIDNLRKILATFRGDLIYSGGLFRLVYRDMNHETVVIPPLTEADFVQESGISSLRVTQPSIFDTPNAVRCRFVNPDKNYQIDDLVVTDLAAVTADGDYREQEVEVLGTHEYANVIKLANYRLERYRVNKQISFKAGPRCKSLEPCDLFSVSSACYGWSDKIFRVESVSMEMDDIVTVSAAEESEAFYNDTYDMATHSYHDTSLPDPTDPVVGVGNLTAEEEVYFYGGRSFTRWKIDFTAPSAAEYPWWDHAEIWTKIGTGDWKFSTTSTAGFMFDPVQEGERYYCKVVSVSTFGAKEAFEDAATISRTIIGRDTSPAAPASVVAIPTGDTVQVIAPDVNEPDLLGYELRLGTSWDAAVFLSLANNGQFYLTGFRPGTHTFWVAPKNNRGLYSVTKRSASCQVLYPPGYTDKATWSWDFRTGTHDGTVYDYYNGAYILKVSRGNVCRNGNFSANTNEWDASGATLSIDAGGYAGNCLKVAASAGDGCASQDIFVKEGRSYTKKFRYKNGAGNQCRYSIYDVTNAAYVTSPTSLTSSLTWSDEQTFTITAPSGCGKIRLALHSLNAGDVFFDNVQFVDNANSLTGTWTSPEYDFGSVVSRRVWGDFSTQVIAGNMTWNGVIPAPLTWNDVLSGGKRWYELFSPTAAPRIMGKIIYGNNSGSLSSSFTNFHYTAPEFEARYVQAEVGITDPVMDTYLNLAVLNMKAAFWQ